MCARYRESRYQDLNVVTTVKLESSVNLLHISMAIIAPLMAVPTFMT